MKNKITFFLLFCVVALFGREPVDVLFYLQDAGETYALVPVMQNLKKRGMTVEVLALGVAKDLLPHEFEPLSFSGPLVDQKWARDLLVPSADIENFVQTVHPRLFVSGVAYRLQGQMIEAFSRLKIPTVAYWDNFQCDGESSYFKTAKSVASLAHHIFVPTQSHQAEWGAKSIVVGQPTLEEWKKKIEEIEPQLVRQKLGVCSCKTVVLFIGGYGEEYQQSLDLFAASCNQSLLSNLYVLIQPHPKNREGIIEESIMNQYNVPYRVIKNEVTTEEAVAISHLVACHQSTVSVQALAAGKPVIHFIPKPQVFESVSLEKGLAQKVTEIEEFSDAWETAMNQKQNSNFFEILETPRNSVKLCSEALLELLE